MFPQFTEDQSAIREAAKDFAMAEIEPGAAARDASGEFPKAIVQQLGEMGFLGMTDVKYIHAEGLAMGPEAVDKAFTQAEDDLLAAIG